MLDTFLGIRDTNMNKTEWNSIGSNGITNSTEKRQAVKPIKLISSND